MIAVAEQANNLETRAVDRRRLAWNAAPGAGST